MENVYVNGKIEAIGSDRHIVDIIRQCCGDDFATLIDIYLWSKISHEASLDNWNCIANDVLDECEKQIEYIEESKRIDKNKLYDSFVEIAKMIRSEL